MKICVNIKHFSFKKELKLVKLLNLCEKYSTLFENIFFKFLFVTINKLCKLLCNCKTYKIYFPNLILRH